MGSAIASLLTTPVAFIGRPRGPPRCKSAPLYHRAQVARPISQGLQGDETPFCALLRPVAPGCALPHPPAPSRTVAPRPLHATAEFIITIHHYHSPAALLIHIPIPMNLKPVARTRTSLFFARFFNC